MASLPIQNIPLTLPTNPMLKTTQFNSINNGPTKYDQKSINLISNNEIHNLGNLKNAILSLTHNLNHQKLEPFSLNKQYSSLIELCADKKALKIGQQIHAHVIKSHGLDKDSFLRTKLVHMYGKCGALMYAHKVFDEMPQRTIFSWNAMIGAYVSNGTPWGALELFFEMWGLSVNVDAYTFVYVLKACGLVKDIHLGSVVHAFALKCGFDSYGFVANSLVSMYAKCEDIVCARQVFESIEVKDDIVLWNSIISGYSMGGMSIEALSIFRDMQNSGVVMNSYTTVSVLQACVGPTFVRLGMELHGAVLKSNDYIHVYAANALLGMYARCGRMREATRIFRMMIDKDSVSWNSMLSAGFVQNGLYNEALDLFREMFIADQKPDQVALISILGACAKLDKLLNGMEAHAYALKTGFGVDIQVTNSLLDMYAKCFHAGYMEHVFKSMVNRDVISWTTAIVGFAQNNCHINALDAFREVQGEGYEVDAMMIGSVLLACTSLKQINLVKETHAYVLRSGLSDLVISNTLVDAYGECGNIALACRMFESIENKDVVSWTSMISVYVDSGYSNDALSLFRAMIRNGVKPDSIALVSVLSAVASLSTLTKGKEIHAFLIKHGFVLEGSIVNSLVDMYARCGTLDNSTKVFNLVKYRDAILWTSMIHANGMHGNGKKATDLFTEMERENVSPDHVTFLALLHACSHSGMTDEGKKYLETMKHRYHLEPWEEHYACVVDLLGRANRLEEAYHFVKNMPIEPNSVVWSALLGACHVHSNVELGDIAAKKLLDLEPDNPGNYVLVSNVFAASRRWRDVELVRERMRQKGLRKNPACSWIEVKNKVHAFIVRDKSHPNSDQIYEKLAQIIGILNRQGGYTPQTKYVLHNVDEEEKIKMLCGHSERLAIAYGLLECGEGTPIRVTKNLRVCGDCHVFIKLVSKFFDREIVVRDTSRFHHFNGGGCSCGDFW